MNFRAELQTSSGEEIRHVDIIAPDDDSAYTMAWEKLKPGTGQRVRVYRV